MADITRLTGTEMRAQKEFEGTPLIEGAAQVLRWARKLPIGEARNELRHLAKMMIGLHRIGYRANVNVLKKHTIH